MMTPDQIEELVEQTATRTAEKIRGELRGMLTALGFNMDPDKAHEEQQMVAFARAMHQGTRYGIRAMIMAVATAAVGWMVWFFTGRTHP